MVEFWNRHAPRPGGGKGIRVDLYNFADIITMFPKRGLILLTQTTSYGCVSARRKKILAEPRALLWLRSGGFIDIHGWHKKARSKTDRRQVWQARTVDIEEADFPESTVKEAAEYVTYKDPHGYYGTKEKDS